MHNKDSEANLCDVCRLEHPELITNQAEIKEQERLKWETFLQDYKRIKRRVLGLTDDDPDPEIVSEIP